MSKNTSRTNKIPKFIKKLNQILEDSKYSSTIGWVQNCNGFHILNPSRFIEEVLPTFFKHKNMASFVRQLNMYGFTRPKESNQNIYENERFIRGNFNSMRQISRRAVDKRVKEQSSIQQPLPSNAGEMSSEQLSDLCMKLLQENKKLRKKNEELCEKLNQVQKNKVQLQSNMERTLETLFNNENNPTKKCHEESMDLVVKWQEKNKNGFHFGEKHGDLNSRLSYMCLVGGSGKFTCQNENKN